MKKLVLTESFYYEGRFCSRLVLFSWKYTSVAHCCARLISRIDSLDVAFRFNLSGCLVARSATYQGV